jgi:hypothetical protein
MNLVAGDISFSWSEAQSCGKSKFFHDSKNKQSCCFFPLHFLSRWLALQRWKKVLDEINAENFV